MKFFCNCSLALAIVALAQLFAFNVVVRGQQPRRDETYPPPDFLKQFQTHHDNCVKKTGVSEVVSFAGAKAALQSSISRRLTTIVPILLILHSDVPCVFGARGGEAIKQFSDNDAHDDAALKCYMNCIFHEVEIVDDNGEVHYEKLKAYIPTNLKDYVMEILMSCESHIPEGETLCERAWSWHLCWKKADSMHYFLP